jgi:spore germination protein KC
LTMLTDQGQEAFASQITIVPVQGEKNESLLITKGAAVFKGDKLIGWLDKTETMALLWVRDEAKEGVVTVSIPPELGGGKMSGKFNHVRSKVSSVPRKDHTKINISLSATLDISEDTSKIDLQSPDERNKLNALFAQEVKRRVEGLCRKVQKEFRSDIFGFGQQMFRQDPQGWETYYAKRWETVYPELEVEVRATVQLVQTGLLGNGSVKEDMR